MTANAEFVHNLSKIKHLAQLLLSFLKLTEIERSPPSSSLCGDFQFDAQIGRMEAKLIVNCVRPMG